jgi:Fe-S cluster biogenesis protein NfuA
MRAEVERVIELLRPALQADGGDILVREVDEESGVVLLELPGGGCRGCATGTRATLEAGVGQILRDRVPGVTEVRQLDCDCAAADCSRP